MSAPAKFYIKSRGFVGTTTTRSMMGTRTVSQWEAWRTVATCAEEAQARDAMAALRKLHPGAYDVAVFHRGKRLP